MLINNKTKTNITLHQIIKHTNTKTIITQLHITITPNNITITLHHKLYHTAHQLLKQTLPTIKHNNILKITQHKNKTTYFNHKTPNNNFLK